MSVEGFVEPAVERVNEVAVKGVQVPVMAIAILIIL
jgi:hypothetical protein